MNETRSHTSIADAPALIRLLLSPPCAASWQDGALVARVPITQSAIDDLLTLDISERTDVDLNFGKEDLTGTVALAFDKPNELWTQALDSFFTLWRRSAFPESAATRPQDLDETEVQALTVLGSAHARLLQGVVAA